MKWVRYDQVLDPIFEIHNCQALLKNFNMPMLLKLRIKLIKAGISVERVTDAVKPI
jgi:hypothetical protein